MMLMALRWAMAEECVDDSALVQQRLVGLSRRSTVDKATGEEAAKESFSDVPATNLSAGKVAVTKESFSYVGQAVISALEVDFKNFRGSAWDMVGDLSLDRIVQTPPEVSESLREAKTFPTACESSSGDCNEDFALPVCSPEGTCAGGGTCTELASTVTKPGESPQKLCIGPADALLDDFYETIISATGFIDITSLDSPDFVAYNSGAGTGRFLAAIRNAITFLSNSGRVVRIRLLFGSIISPLGSSNEMPTKLLDALTRDLPDDSSVELYGGAYRSGATSWNHGKIVAVDGKRLIEGGINFYTSDYLKKDPVFDISIKVQGRAALTAHGYADYLWTKGVCGLSSVGLSETAYSNWKKGKRTDYSTWTGTWPCPAGFKSASSSNLHTGALAIPAARLGSLGAQPADEAFIAMFSKAKANVRISSQDFGPVKAVEFWYGWPDSTISELNKGLARGVQVQLLLSTPCAYGGGEGKTACSVSLLQASTGQNGSSEGGPYGYGWSAETVLTKFTENADWPKDSSAQQNLEIAYTGVGGKQWRDGEGVGNHAKFFAIDDQAFYVGSQNLYKCDLAEFGIIVDDKSATARMIAEYFDPLWASRTTVRPD